MRALLNTLLGISLILVSQISNAQKKWSVVGTRAFSTALFKANIALDTGGTPYVAFIDTANNNEVTVKKYDGTAWVQLGSTGFYAGPHTEIWIVIDDRGVPYAAYNDINDNYHIVVISYNGNTWSQVGSAGLSVNLTATTGNPLAAGKNGIVYVAGVVLGKAAVLKYDGTNWVVVGNTGISRKLITHATIDVDSKNNPCIAYEEDSLIKQSGGGNLILKMMTVLHYNGSTWQTLGGTGYYILNAWDPIIKFDSKDTAYVAFQDLNGPGHKGSMLKYYDTGVSVVGYPRFTPFLGFHEAAMDKNAGVPYVLYSDWGSSGPYNGAMTFDGVSWNYLGSFTSSYALRPSVAMDNNGRLYVAFLENQKVTVMKYDYCPPVARVNLCAVYNDTITYNNFVTWDEIGGANIDSYKIYREDNGKYELIVALSASQYSYLDTNVKPYTNSYRYKLAVLDSCGVETILDSAHHHRTMLLTFNYLIDSKASISWNKYEGIASPVYKVMRSNNNYSFTEIASITMQGNDTTYIDVNPPLGSNVYRIEIPLPDPCGQYRKITSNIATAWKTGVETLTGKSGIMVSPNPAHTMITVTAPGAIKQVSVSTPTGRIVVSEEIVNPEQRVDIRIDDLPAGVYLLKVNNIYNAIFIKQ